MDLSHDMEAATVSSLGEAPLEELEQQVDQRMGFELSRQQVLNTYLVWLRERLVKGIVNVESWARSLLTREFKNDKIFQEFKKWQRRDAQEDPCSLRRYLMVEQDLSDFLGHQNQLREDYRLSNTVDAYGPALSKENQRPPQDSDASYSADVAGLFNRQQGSKKATRKTSILVKRGTKVSTSGANDVPIMNQRSFGLEHSTVSMPKGEIGGISAVKDVFHDVDMQKPSAKTRVGEEFEKRVKSKKSNPDGLTSTRETILLESPQQVYLKEAHPEASYALRQMSKYSKKTFLGFADGPPGPEYRCRRCHWLQSCPTNLDPAYDVSPDPGYKCDLCGRKGHHFVTLCPMNTKKGSLTQIRKEAGLTEAAAHRRGRSHARERRRRRRSTDSYRPDQSPGNRDREGVPPLHYQEESPRDRPSPFHSQSGRDSPSGPLPASSPPRILLRNTVRSPQVLKSYCFRPSPKEVELRGPYKQVPSKNEGRLSYDDEDVFMTDDLTHSPTTHPTEFPSSTDHVGACSPLLPNVARRSEKRKRQVDDTEEVPTRPSTSIRSLGAFKHAESEADDFLKYLGLQIQNKVDNSNVEAMDIVFGAVTQPSPALEQQSGSSPCQHIVGFSPYVQNLFAGRKNTIVNFHTKRATAVDLW